MTRLDQRTVIAVAAEAAEYPLQPPFHPHADYPEYAGQTKSSAPNHAYHTVRECFRLAGLDAARFGTADWNPLGELIRPGEIVLLKPNLVKEFHPRDSEGWQYVVTHGSVVRVVADYAFAAAGKQGRVIVADAPQTDSSFEQLRRRLGLDAMAAFYDGAGYTLDIVDLRKEEWTEKDDVIVDRRRLAGDPNGYVAFDLGDDSEFVGHTGSGRYYGADYDYGEVNRHHSGGRHEYLISGTALAADVVFSLPKLKTHKKAGITASLKNLVGLNGDKNWLPHHTEAGRGEAGRGDPGDERPNPGKKHRLERSLLRKVARLSLAAPRIGPWIHRQARRFGRRVFGDTEEVIRSGNWWGNDTVWRMCLDLNKIALYGNPDGSLRPGEPAHRKRHYVLVDGIVAGEGRGPMNPDPVDARVVLFGIHPASVDAAAAWLMGFDPERIPIVRQAFRCRRLPLAEWDWHDVRLVSNRTDWCGPLEAIGPEATFHFAPHFGWRGHIERSVPDAAAEVPHAT